MKKIALLLANGFEAVEASVFTDVFGWNKWEGDGSTEVITMGLHPQLTCTWNFTVTPERCITTIDLSEFDALAIPGGFEEAGFYEDAFSPACRSCKRRTVFSGPNFSASQMASPAAMVVVQ